MIEINWWQLLLILAGSPALAGLVSWVATRKKSKVDMLDIILTRLEKEVTRLENLYLAEKKTERRVKKRSGSSGGASSNLSGAESGGGGSV